MLQDISEQNLNFNIFMGFDGFVDKILRPIKVKTQDKTVPFKSMREFAEYLGEKSGKSCSIDLELMQEKIGGNMPIAANALGNLGCRTMCVGAMGVPEISPVFQKMSMNCLLSSVSEPGYCSALEFEDGKVMMATNTAIDGLDYNQIMSHLSEEVLIEYINSCDAATFLNWGELLGSNDIWENILLKIIPKCTFSKKKIMLVDFSDFSRRGEKEVQRMLEILNKYDEYFDITISLNKNELDLFLDKLEIGKERDSQEERIVELSKRFVCKNFVVHLLETSCYVKNEKAFQIKKDVIKKPKIITGGGDNFNAGLLIGLLLEFDIEKAIRTGAALSCLYVEKGEGIQLCELLNYEF